jgi:biopolymer transport protein ExbB/TolQ
MEIFGGFMAMMSMVSLFLAIVWLIMPFVVFAIKGKQERTLEMLAELKEQLCRMEERLERLEAQKQPEQVMVAHLDDLTAQTHNSY